MKTLVTRILLAALIVTALPLFAQSQTQEQKPPDDKPAAEQPQKVTEEMVVTARKREESVQEVPMSVAAPSEQHLRDLGATTIEDVATNVAGFTVQGRSSAISRA